MSLGILGGTFDPIHFGHLRLAVEMAETLGLDQVRLIPAGAPPHRGRPRATPAQRLEMTRRAVADHPLLAVDDREVVKEGPSYTVDTLTALRAEQPQEAPLVLLLGADALLGLTTWHQWTRLFDLAHLAVAHRPGFPAAAWEDALPDDLRRELARRRTDQPGDLADQPSGCIYLQSITQLDISATRIRERALRGQSLHFLLPDPVIDYIQEHHLYV